MPPWPWVTNKRPTTEIPHFCLCSPPLSNLPRQRIAKLLRVFFFAVEDALVGGGEVGVLVDGAVAAVVLAFVGGHDDPFGKFEAQDSKFNSDDIAESQIPGRSRTTCLGGTRNGFRPGCADLFIAADGGGVVRLTRLGASQTDDAGSQIPGRTKTILPLSGQAPPRRKSRTGDAIGPYSPEYAWGAESPRNDQE